MSSTDANFHAAHNLIYAIHNPKSASPLAELGSGHKETLKTVVKVLRKSISPKVPPRVPVRRVDQDKLK